jgi:hypothetical protein
MHRAAPPTKPPPKPPGLGSVLENNIRALQERRAREEAKATLQDRIALSITRFTGSMGFVYLHIFVFTAWIVVNLGLVPGFPQFDASFVTLAMMASVEAIFLSTFILITQNRMSSVANKRAELDLQISLLAEHASHEWSHYFPRWLNPPLRAEALARPTLIAEGATHDPMTPVSSFLLPKSGRTLSPHPPVDTKSASRALHF